MISDPFQQVYDGLWDFAELNPRLMNVIKPGNREKYDKWIGMKKDVSSSDLPELSLMTDGAVTNMQNTSTTSYTARRYRWVISTGDFRVCLYNQICWELFRAMIPWHIALCSLYWPEDFPENRFVKKAELLNLEEGTLRTLQNRGIRGWSSIWGVQVDFYFCTNTLINYCP